MNEFNKLFYNFKKLQIPDNIQPTKFLRISWLVSPFGNNYGGTFPVWVPFAGKILLKLKFCLINPPIH